MKRIGRIIYGWLAALSAMLFVAACVTGVVVWGKDFAAQWTGAAHRMNIEVRGGLVNLSLAFDTGRGAKPGWITRTSKETQKPIRNWGLPAPGRGGFAFFQGRTIGRPRGNWLAGDRPLLILWFPLWAVALVTAILPSWWSMRAAIRFRRRRRILAGLCVKCGYDLRATPGKCPECGAEPQANRKGTA